jgi:hypothetical protein
MRAQPYRSTFLSAVLVVCLTGGLHGQAIRGQVVDRTSGHPVARGFVVVQDTAGTEVARTLTDDQGRFYLRAPAAGTYRLQSKRIGFRASTSPRITLAAGATQDVRFEIEAIPVRLPAVLAAGQPKCGEAEGAEVGQLWEEIHEALAAVSWTSRQPYRYEKALYERKLDVFGKAVKRERTRQRSGAARHVHPGRSADRP